ncbi:MAG: OmpA family protein, partial [Myxococcota bacterium]
MSAIMAFISTANADPGRTGDVLPDGTVRFQIGSYELTARSEAVLDRLAELLKRRRELDPVLLVGHTDDSGSQSVNIALSVKRARAVKAALVKRGLQPSRLQVEGVGSQEPLTLETTDEARSQNRRVELWVTPRGPVARVGRIQRRVEAREAAAPEWSQARRNQALRRLSRVRTLARSSSEILFPKDDRVTMGPQALAIVYGTPSATRRGRRAVSDVELEEGSLFAQLAQREGRSMQIAAGTGRVQVRSKRTRVNVSPKRAQSTIEVYDGESQVGAKGKWVTVPRGYGTRVQDGQAPEPPSPLPEPPTWQETQPIFRFEGEPVDLHWRPQSRLAAVEWQLGVGNDLVIARPVRLEQVSGQSVSTRIAPGVYVARLAGIDKKGLVGQTGSARQIIVLPALQTIPDQRPIQRTKPGAPLRLARPSRVRFTAPPSSELSILGQTITSTVDVDVFTSRTVVVGVKATDGGPTQYIPLAFEVPQYRVATSVGRPKQTADGSIQVPIDIHVTDETGQGVDGLSFKAGA